MALNAISFLVYLSFARRHAKLCCYMCHSKKLLQKIKSKNLTAGVYYSVKLFV